MDNFETLSEAVNALTLKGYSENFEAGDEFIVGLYSKKNYSPNDLLIVQSFRFEGMTNPEDQSILFAIEANDGNKGTLIMSYQAEHSQNTELIKAIKFN